ncbi:MAG: thiolase domain-containing protein [Nitrososphaeria archaeon]|nr:thiolase domain-containing protein [Nitrososphaeria archaeon]NIN52920.1 thiolase domain-containing protein [Nitrososphaeria archaeon]NIQ33479.1 thiolase domain-containing protein [Nitrososphaeria archaeon]
MRSVYVLAAAQTKFGKMRKTAREAAVIAAKEAIELAGIEADEVEGAFVTNAFGVAERQGHLGPIIMSSLGIPEAPATTVESACASGGSALREAFINVAAGFYDVMLVVGSEKVSHLDTLTATTYFSYGSDYLLEGGNAAGFPGLYAAMATAHMNRYGTTEEQMAFVSVKNHKNAMFNPKAHFHKEVTVEDVLNSMVVTSPLKLFDCCPFSDGAAAAVLCSEEIAKRHTDTPISIIGSGRAGTSGALHDREELTTIASTVLAVRQALKQAHIALEEVNFAEVHDCFTIAEIMAIEDIGFVEKGEGGKATEEGLTDLDGNIPINPSGGLKAKGHPVAATGIGQVVEAFEQLRVEAGKRQIDGAEVALLHNIGATGGSCAVHILRRD